MVFLFSTQQEKISSTFLFVRKAKEERKEENNKMNWWRISRFV